MNPLIQSKNKTVLPVLITLTFACFALSPAVEAVSPPPDGGYPGGNTAAGQGALLSLTAGINNTAIGIYSLLSLTDGDFCTGVGAGTLLANTGDQNTATGAGALLSNTEGSSNTANGAFALFSNTASYENTAMGAGALTQNDISGHELAIDNTAVGFYALNANVDGDDNTAVGAEALLSNNNAPGNTAVGVRTLMATTDGSFNTAIGVSAMRNNVLGNTNTIVGAVAGFNLVNGVFNTYLGDLVGAQAPDENSVIRIADLSSGYPMNACFIGGIFGNPTVGVPVYINANGQLSTTASSARFKDEIKPMEKASEAIFALTPVTFRYKHDLDPKGIPQFGLVAEDVEKVNPDLVARDAEGKPYTVRYEAVNAMLLNEFLKEHAAFLTEQRKVDQLEKQVAVLTTELQKVSAQLEESKLTPQVVANDQ